jgi:hypothetical protein
MLRKVKLFAVDVVATALLLTLSACGGSSGTILVTSVSITPATVSDPINTCTEFTATLALSNTTSTSVTPTTVTWEVNGVSGGTGTSGTGTIVSLPADILVGNYCAPSSVPSTNNGQVNITAVTPQNPSTSTTSTSTTTLITSNTAVLTITVGQGLAVTPTTATVPAGGSQLFSATLNSVLDPNATWSISPNEANFGTIEPTTGLYTAPLYPPPGGVVTITASDGAVTTTSTAQIVYSDHSFNGPFAFSYVGDDSSGFLAVAGSLTADGNGHILSGIEDIVSFSASASTQVPITGGTYMVGADGRTTAVLNTLRSENTLQFALTTNQHGLLIRFDKNTTGSGTIDEQDLDALTNSLSVISGPYVFGVFGADAQFAPMGIAGRFSADGSGNIPATGTVLDANDNGTVTTMDTSLNGSYSIDLANVGSGRGVLSLSSTTTKQIQYTFYFVDGTHMHVVETDGHAYLAGDVFSALAGSSFSSATLASGNYVFTGSGMSSSGAYTAGGVFASDGNGNVSGGVLDTNNAGTVALNTSVGSCPYATDPVTGRIDLKIFAGSGSCPSGSNSSLSEFAVYQTSLESALVLELDANAISSGLAYQQAGVPVVVQGSFALNLAGRGIFRNAPASYQPHVEGQVTLTGAYVPAGTLDIDNYSSVYASDPMTATNSTLSTPDSIHGRGTAAFAGSDPTVTYKLVYYVIDSNTALLFDQDSARFMTGIIAIQY